MSTFVNPFFYNYFFVDLTENVELDLDYLLNVFKPKVCVLAVVAIYYFVDS